jgi:hypothetical protein
MTDPRRFTFRGRLVDEMGRDELLEVVKYAIEENIRIRQQNIQDWDVMVHLQKASRRG